MTETTRAPFRLAIRKEGRFVNAYLAAENTMDGALMLGSILVRLVRGHDDFFDQWKALMVEMFSIAVEDALGTAPVSMTEERAPEHEKSGEA